MFVCRHLVCSALLRAGYREDLVRCVNEARTEPFQNYQTSGTIWNYFHLPSRSRCYLLWNCGGWTCFFFFGVCLSVRFLHFICILASVSMLLAGWLWVLAPCSAVWVISVSVFRTASIIRAVLTAFESLILLGYVMFNTGRVTSKVTDKVVRTPDVCVGERGLWRKLQDEITDFRE